MLFQGFLANEPTGNGVVEDKERRNVYADDGGIKTDWLYQSRNRLLMTTIMSDVENHSTPLRRQRLTQKQERRLVDYLEGKFLNITGNYKKR